MAISDVIVVIGATGNQGGAVAARLLSQGWGVRAVTRDTASVAAQRLARAGAEVVPGHLDDPASLERAFVGAHGVFSVQQGALGAAAVPYDDEVRRGRSVADIAVSSGVRHLVYASVAGADRARHVRAFGSKWEIEEHVRRSDIPATILRPVSFMENYVDPAFGVQTGRLATPFVADVPEQLIALADIGVFAGLAFAGADQYVGRTVTIAGDELRPPDIAAILSQAAGRHIPYVQVPLEDVRRFNPALAEAADFLNQQGGYGADVASIRTLYPGLMSFADWMADEGAARVAKLF